MNILFFTYDIPYPLNTGGKIRAYYLLKSLAKKHTITLVSFYRTSEQLEMLKELSFISKIHVLKRRSLYSVKNLPHIISHPFPAALYFDREFIKMVKTIQDRTDIDCIHYESFYTSIFLNENLKIPQIIGTENIEWHVYEQYLNQQPRFVRPLLAPEVRRIKSFEEDSWKKATSCIAVSSDNASFIENISGKKCEIIPNGVDLTQFQLKKRQEMGKNIQFLFVGSMYYIQNKDALNWLISSIWPKIKDVLTRHNKNGTLSIVGPGTDTLSVTDEAVTCFGEVDDIGKIYNESDILLAPLRAGSGTKFKVLESAAIGNLVITTEIGMEGLDGFTNYEELLIANTEDEFAQSVDFALRNPHKIKTITEKARTAVEKNYGWDAIGKKLLTYYETIINNHR